MENKKRENEIVEKYEFLTERSRDLTNQMNDNWAIREELRKEYTTLTGKDISERHKVE